MNYRNLVSTTDTKCKVNISLVVWTFCGNRLIRIKEFKS